MIELEAAHLAEVRRILSELAPDCDVWAYGSRVTRMAKPYSDLDLVLIGPADGEGLSFRRLGTLKEAFEGSALPFRVDLLDWRRASEAYRKVFEAGYEVVQPAK